MNSVSPDEFNMYQEQNGTSNNSQQNQPNNQPLQYNNTTTVHHQHQQQTSTSGTHFQQQPVYNNTQSQQQQQPVYNNTNNVNRSMSNSGNSSGPLYNNLIPGHYRYGVKPPEPPPGPLSYSNTSSISSSHTHYHQNGRQQPIDNNRSYQNTTSSQPSSYQKKHQSNGFDIIQVLEPDDDDYIGIDSSSIDIEDDDEQYYRPFRHTSTTVSASTGKGGAASISNSSSNKKTSKKKKQSKHVQQQQHQEEERPVDLLAVLLNDCTSTTQDDQQGEGSNDIATLISEASTKSQRARALTNSLAAKQYQCGGDDSTTATKDNKKGGNEDADNDLYAITSNAHTDAAVAFQRVYRILLGLDDLSSLPPSPSSSQAHALSTRTNDFKPLSQSEEIAKSMMLLSNIHIRMSKSLIDMGLKWNMGNVDSKTGRMITKKSDGDMGSCGVNVDEKNVDGKKSAVSSDENKGKDASKTSAKDETTSDTSTATSSTPTEAQHERLRMAVRGALDTTNHEEDLTNSTFLARSTLMNNTKTSSKKPSVTKSKNKLLASTARASGNIMNRVMDPKKKNSNIDPNNPVDDLMKLEKELQCMDMQLEMGNSVANLNSGGGGGVRPDGSFMVVPTGSGASFMSSSSMWTSGILNGGGGNAQQQQHSKPPPNGRANPRSRANHLQSFQGNKQAPPSASHRPQIAAGLDQSWWGGGQASILASSAIATAASNTSKQHLPHTSESPNGTSDPSSSTNQASSSTNTKQLMQLMDSLNRLGNENAQLMREVEDAKAARAEAKAAKEMMSKFKNEYSSRFNKVKEALTKYPQNNNASGDNPVVNRYVAYIDMFLRLAMLFSYQSHISLPLPTIYNLYQCIYEISIHA